MILLQCEGPAIIKFAHAYMSKLTDEPSVTLHSEGCFSGGFFNPHFWIFELPHSYTFFVCIVTPELH